MELDIVTLHSFLFASSLDHNFLLLSFFFPRASNWLRFCIPCIMCLSHAMLCFVTQSCLILCNAMDCSPPGSSARGIFQARIPEWVAMPSSRGSSQPKDWTQFFRKAGGFSTPWATREAMGLSYFYIKIKVSAIPLLGILMRKPEWKETHVPQCSSQHCL